MTNLEILRKEHGKEAEAEQWFRKAANAGVTLAMTLPSESIGRPPRGLPVDCQAPTRTGKWGAQPACGVCA
jgi:hypothetical protein